jgi:hypothetical protein
VLARVHARAGAGEQEVLKARAKDAFGGRATRQGLAVLADYAVKLSVKPRAACGGRGGVAGGGGDEEGLQVTSRLRLA